MERRLSIQKNHQKGNLRRKKNAFRLNLIHKYKYHSYYAFVESPSAVPPKVRPPPYTHVNLECKDLASKKSYVSVHNICGDLNKGQIPRNPMRQNVMGEPYPL